MTPVTNPTNEAEELYYRALVRTRVIVELTLGVVKNRFRCIHRFGGELQYTPLRSAQIVSACLLLHNRCVSRSIPDPNNHLPEEDMPIEAHVVGAGDRGGTGESVKSTYAEGIARLEDIDGVANIEDSDGTANFENDEDDDLESLRDVDDTESLEDEDGIANYEDDDDDDIATLEDEDGIENFENTDNIANLEDEKGTENFEDEEDAIATLEYLDGITNSEDEEDGISTLEADNNTAIVTRDVHGTNDKMDIEKKKDHRNRYMTGYFRKFVGLHQSNRSRMWRRFGRRRRERGRGRRSRYRTRSWRDELR
ncbi:hypothetical protein Pcinc_010659 [Petrolisthes cinctipes]|uniref:DDE Tnp4 domain-containing protein n=1 Tax=Petrolisthes cinctipes TaxID=88211 RepID=A0AAE1G8L1_PETCI|nr:hypothetical protein Pcinc_010659 [Petrolisthes cinctipes]